MAGGAHLLCIEVHLSLAPQQGLVLAALLALPHLLLLLAHTRAPLALGVLQSGRVLAPQRIEAALELVLPARPGGRVLALHLLQRSMQVVHLLSARLHLLLQQQGVGLTRRLALAEVKVGLFKLGTAPGRFAQPLLEARAVPPRALQLLRQLLRLRRLASLGAGQPGQLVRVGLETLDAIAQGVALGHDGVDVFLGEPPRLAQLGDDGVQLLALRLHLAELGFERVARGEGFAQLLGRGGANGVVDGRRWGGDGRGLGELELGGQRSEGGGVALLRLLRRALGLLKVRLEARGPLLPLGCSRLSRAPLALPHFALGS